MFLSFYLFIYFFVTHSSNQVLGMYDTPFACAWFLPLALLFLILFFFFFRWFLMGIGYSGWVVVALVVSMALMVVVVVF